MELLRLRPKIKGGADISRQTSRGGERRGGDGLQRFVDKHCLIPLSGMMEMFSALFIMLVTGCM